MTTTLPFDAITHPASKRLFRVSDLTQAQRMAVSTFVAADCAVLRAVGAANYPIHDSITLTVFESLPDIRYLYVHPHAMGRVGVDSALVKDIARYGAYLMRITGQIEPDDFETRDFENVVKELFPQNKFFWPLLNSWCDVLVELGLARQTKQELYLHDVLEEHRITFPDKHVLTPAASKLWDAVDFVRGDVAVAILGIEYKMFKASGERSTSTTPIHLKTQPRERFVSTRLGERAICLGCGEKFEGARIIGIRKVRAHIPKCLTWNRLDDLASQMLPTSASDLNVIVDRALEKGSIPRFDEYINLRDET